MINLKIQIQDMIEQIVADAQRIKEEAIKVDKGNKAACTRVRVGLMGIIKDCKAIREAVMKSKKG